MADLYIAIAIMAGLSVASLFLTLRLTKSVPRFVCDMLALLMVLAMAFYIRDVWHSVWLFEMLPFSSLVILGNWFPLVTSILVGLVWQRLTGNPFRKSIFVVPLLLVGAFSVVYPLLGEPPVCEDEWRNGVCLQTSQFSCSAACAATLLHHADIEATEQELARLCLTRRGTTWQGLFRGLKLKTADTEWDVEVFECGEGELQAMLPGPKLLSVELEEDANVERSYAKKNGWILGQPHAVVLFDFLGKDLLEVGDPSNGDDGREKWRSRDLHLLWHGSGMRLVKREPPPAESSP